MPKVGSTNLEMQNLLTVYCAHEKLNKDEDLNKLLKFNLNLYCTVLYCSEERRMISVAILFLFVFSFYLLMVLIFK